MISQPKQDSENDSTQTAVANLLQNFELPDISGSVGSGRDRKLLLPLGKLFRWMMSDNRTVNLIFWFPAFCSKSPNAVSNACAQL